MTDLQAAVVKAAQAWMQAKLDHQRTPRSEVIRLEQELMIAVTALNDAL